MLYVGLFFLALIVFLIYAYNKGIMARNFTSEAFATMDVYLKKRWDLVPNLLELVKQYAKHEEKLLTEVTKLRTQNYSALPTDEKINVNNQLGKALSQVLAVAENYPDLKANQNYNLLMQQLSAIEDDIANARKYYNGTVRLLNNYCDLFPTNLVAAKFGIERGKMFEISADERNNVKVDA